MYVFIIYSKLKKFYTRNIVFYLLDKYKFIFNFKEKYFHCKILLLPRQTNYNFLFRTLLFIIYTYYIKYAVVI